MQSCCMHANSLGMENLYRFYTYRKPGKTWRLEAGNLNAQSVTAWGGDCLRRQSFKP